MTVNNDIQRDQIGSLSKKSRLEQALTIGVDRVPEIKREEKMLFLGEFRERVIRKLSKKQVANPSIFPEIKEALKDKRTLRMLINGDLSYKFTEKYIKLAKEVGKPFTTIHNSELKGDTGLVVISDQAIDIQNIDI
ncbi:MAG TPA: YueI family protein [Desulfosporosinus sp.]|nr:YueI family protein [Desulfosporosinus sp.]